MNVTAEGSPPLPPTPAPALLRSPWFAPALTLFALILLSVLAGFLSYYLQVAVWQFWDDEGYVMVSVSRFLQGKPLYSDVFSQYGPAYYLFQWIALAPVAHQVTHDAVRVETLFFWGYVALFAGLTAYRLTRSPVAAFAAHLQTFVILNKLTDEPGHPQGLCLFFLANAVFAATFFKSDRQRRNVIAALTVGFCIGSLIAIKVNLGVYLGFAAVLTLLLLSPPTRLWNWITAVAGPVLLVAFVALLLRSNGGVEWVQSLAISVLAGAIGAFGIARFVWVRSHAPGAPLAAGSPPITWMIAPAVIGALAGIVVPALFVLMRGTPPADIWHGMVGQHLGFDSQFTIPMANTARPVLFGVVTAVVSFVLVSGVSIVIDRQERLSDPGQTKGIMPPPSVLIPLLILAVSELRFYLGWQSWSRLAIGAEKQYFLELLPVLWLVLVPRNLASLPDRNAVLSQFLPRVLLVLTTILEALWVYPVAGTQVNMASYLPALASAVLLADGLTEAVEALTRLAAARRKAPTDGTSRLGGDPARAIATLLGIGMFLLCTFHYRGMIAQQKMVFDRNVPLNLPGSRLIRLPEKRVETLRSVTNYLRDNSDTVIMLPGLYSFYFWLERDPPTGRNAGAWPILLGDAEQEELVRVYRERAESGRVVGIYNPNALNIWTNTQRHAKDESGRPLFRYIAREFVPAAQFEDFLLLKPRPAGKTAAP